jgi:hypothetical protein
VRNSFPQICEFKVKFEPTQDAEGCFDCVVELRIASDEIPLGDEFCEIAFRKITISVDNEGTEILANSRFGEPRKPNSIPLTKETEITESAKSLSGWRAKVSSTKKPSLTGHAGREIKRGTSSLKQYREEGQYRRVKARPNDRWEVTEPAQQLLDDTYLCDDILFSIEVNKKANRTRSSLSLKIKQRDLAINGIFADDSSKKFFGRIGENQKRLIDIFISKSLSQLAYTDRKYAGEIILAEFEHEFFDED